MTQQRTEKQNSHKELSKREVRAERILDAAAMLIQKWGYSKTTIDDIARQAGVAKGTIYLHWKTREDLFFALTTREGVKLAEDMKQRIASDPQGATLHGFVKHTTLAIFKSPLMKALFLKDTEMLGVWANKEYTSTTYTERIVNYKTFLESLRAHGIVSTEIDIYRQTYILSSLWLGFLLADPWMPDEFKFSDEEVAEMLADSVERVLAPRHPTSDIDANAQREVANALNQYMDQEVSSIKDLQKEFET